MDFPVFDKEGTTTLIEGKRRQGKGILNAFLTLMAADSGTRIRSNYRLQTPNYQSLTFYEFVSMLKRDEPFEPYIVVSLQEIQGWLSSHRSMSDSSEIADNLIFQASKLGINIVGDSQLNMRVGNSLRGMANYRYEAECDETNQQFIYWELDIHYPNNSIRTEESFTIPFEVAALWWNRFNTYERSTPLGMGSLLMKMEKLEPSLMNATIERQATILTEKPELLTTYTKIGVERALMRCGEETAFAPYVLDELKQRYRNQGSTQQTENLMPPTKRPIEDSLRIWSQHQT